MTLRRLLRGGVPAMSVCLRKGPFRGPFSHLPQRKCTATYADEPPRPCICSKSRCVEVPRGGEAGRAETREKPREKGPAFIIAHGFAWARRSDGIFERSFPDFDVGLAS